MSLIYDQFTGFPRTPGVRIASTSDKLIKVLDTMGRATIFDYYSTGGFKGHLRSVTDFTGRSVQYGYDVDANMTSVVELPALPALTHPGKSGKLTA